MNQTQTATPVAPTATLNRDASDLGLRPGNFPRQLTVSGTTFYGVSRKRDAEYEIVWVRYRATNGATLIVWND